MGGELGPTVFIGSLAWIKAVRTFLLESDRDRQIEETFRRPPAGGFAGELSGLAYRHNASV